VVSGGLALTKHFLARHAHNWPIHDARVLHTLALAMGDGWTGEAGGGTCLSGLCQVPGLGYTVGAGRFRMSLPDPLAMGTRLRHIVLHLHAGEQVSFYAVGDGGLGSGQGLRWVVAQFPTDIHQASDFGISAYDDCGGFPAQGDYSFDIKKRLIVLPRQGDPRCFRLTITALTAVDPAGVLLYSVEYVDSPRMVGGVSLGPLVLGQGPLGQAAAMVFCMLLAALATRRLSGWCAVRLARGSRRPEGVP
jgi:hypothetical protein